MILWPFYWLTFEKNFEALAFLESCHVTFAQLGIKQKFEIFEVFRAYLIEFLIFFS